MLGREALRALKSQRKAQKFKAMINEKELYLITDEKQRLYYTGYQSTDGYLLLGRGFSYFVIDSRYFHAANKLLSKKGVNVILGSGYSALKDIMYKTGCDTLGIDFTKTSLHEYKIFEEAGYKLKDISKEIADAMRVKSPADLRKIKKACKIAQTALKQLLPEIKEGVRERELAASLEYKMKMLGASGPSFETIVAFGANAAIPHHVTGETILKKNMPVLIDFGCVYEGYCSDMTRTFFYGKPDKEFTRCYNAVLKAHEEAAKNITDGTDCAVADSYARKVLEDAGIQDHFTHSLGHGIGVYIHESPALSPRGQGELKNSMVFSIEPGVYFDDKFGIRIEDTVTLENGKVKSFMTYTKKLVKLK